MTCPFCALARGGESGLNRREDVVHRDELYERDAELRWRVRKSVSRSRSAYAPSSSAASAVSWSATR